MRGQSTVFTIQTFTVKCKDLTACNTHDMMLSLTTKEKPLMAKCTHCEKKIEMRVNMEDKLNKVKRPRMEWVHLRDLGWAIEHQTNHMVTEFSDEVGHDIVIGNQDHYIGDKAPSIQYYSWYLEEHSDLFG